MTTNTLQGAAMQRGSDWSTKCNTPESGPWILLFIHQNARMQAKYEQPSTKIKQRTYGHQVLSPWCKQWKVESPGSYVHATIVKYKGQPGIQSLACAPIHAVRTCGQQLAAVSKISVCVWLRSCAKFYYSKCFNLFMVRILPIPLGWPSGAVEIVRCTLRSNSSSAVGLSCHTLQHIAQAQSSHLLLKRHRVWQLIHNRGGPQLEGVSLSCHSA